MHDCRPLSREPARKAAGRAGSQFERVYRYNRSKGEAMANSSLPLNIDAIEKLIRDGSRLVDVTRPVWQEVGRLASRIPARRYLPIAAGVAAAVLVGVALASTKRTKPRTAPRPAPAEEDVEMALAP